MDLSTVVRTALLALLAAIASTIGAASAYAQSSYFRAMLDGSISQFDALPAYRTRIYVGGLIAALNRQCPTLNIPSHPGPLEAGQYRIGSIGSVSLIARAAEDAAFFAAADSDADIAAYSARHGCDQTTHSRWIRTATSMLRDPLLAGSIQSFASETCTQLKYRGDHSDCSCFATSFDMETTPNQRRNILQTAQVHDTLREMLVHGGLAQIISGRCSVVPDLVTGAPSAPGNSSAAVQIADGGYDLLGTDWRNGPQRMPLLLVDKIGANRYRFSWTSGGAFAPGIASVSGSTVTVQPTYGRSYSGTIDSEGRLIFMKPAPRSRSGIEMILVKR